MRMRFSTPSPMTSQPPPSSSALYTPFVVSSPLPPSTLPPTRGATNSPRAPSLPIRRFTSVSNVAARMSATTSRSRTEPPNSCKRVQMKSRTAFVRNSRGVSPSTPCPLTRSASDADTWVTSGPTATTPAVLGTAANEYRSHILASHSFPASSYTCSIPCTRFLFPYAYILDVFLRASLAQTLFVSDCTPDRDYPLSCFLSETYFIVEDAPHHLIITLPSCTLRVFPLSRIFISRFTMITPPTIKSQIDTFRRLTFFRRY